MAERKERVVRRAASPIIPAAVLLGGPAEAASGAAIAGTSFGVLLALGVGVCGLIAIAKARILSAYPPQNRREHRHDVTLDAPFRDARGSGRVRVLDLSRNGARVAFETARPAADVFELSLDGRSLKCRVRWQEATECGVTFDRSLSHERLNSLLTQSRAGRMCPPAAARPSPPVSSASDTSQTPPEPAPDTQPIPVTASSFAS